MNSMAPMPKLILTVAVSVWAMAFHSILALGVLVGAELVLILLAGAWSKTYKGILSLSFFAVLLIGIQYIAGLEIGLASIIGLRMMAMTLVFIVLLTTTKLQELTAALVTQCHIPYEYAFMLTAALRFIPDFLAESKAVQEAQACRGYHSRGNVFRKITSYLTIVQPLILRAISRSEVMAMSLELRGFGAKGRSFSINVALKGKDYLFLVVIGSITIYVL